MLVESVPHKVEGIEARGLEEMGEETKRMQIRG